MQPQVSARLFKSHTKTADRAKEILELPGDMQHSELHVYIPNAEQATSLPDTMAWMTGWHPPPALHGWSLIMLQARECTTAG